VSKRRDLTDWECLIVDDQSTDDSATVADRIADTDDRIYTLRTPSNLKLSGARNYGFEHANGRYILFLDADDMLAPNALDTLSHALDEDTGIHIAYGHLDTFNDPNPERSGADGPVSASIGTDKSHT
jgi:glycosyltransferase involved in cell wall biosynthesis